jgi:hypothetical protein
MLLSEIFDQLTHGELSQLSIGGAAVGHIQQKDYPVVISHVNMALTELYKRFPIKVREVQIQEYASIGTYYLDSDYSIITGTAATKYLIDSETVPFEDDVLKITRVYDEAGVELPVNDANDVTSIITRSYKSFEIANPLDTATITVEYRADHVMIDAGELDADAVEVELPRSLLEALLNYVAFRAFSAQPATLDGGDRAGVFMQKFEASVQRITNLDLVNAEEKPNQKLSDNGWP